MLRRFWRLPFLCFCLFLAACNLINEAEITAEPTLDIPTVEILEPGNNRQIIEGTEFEFDIVGRDNGAGVAQIRLYIDETLIGEAFPVEAEAVPVFRARINWLAQGQGRHPVEVIAYRADGTRSDAAEITIEVLPSE
jgi:hypothetical protein